MARLTLTYSDLYTQVSNFLGLTARGTAPTGTDLTTCKDIVDRGYRAFLYPLDDTGKPHHWEFLKVHWTLNTVKDQWKYALPLGFSDMCGTFHYDGTNADPPLTKRNAEQILEYRANVSSSTGSPTHFAITPSKYDLEIGTRYETWLWPSPNQAYTLHSFYYMDPIQLSGTSDLAVGGIRAVDAILESCLAEAEVQEDDTVGLHSQRAREMVLKLIKFDRVTETDLVGNLYTDKHTKQLSERDILSNPNMDNVYS